MTSRERVRAALNHRQPDRVPVDFGSTMVTGISVSVVLQLRKALGLDGPDARVKVIEPYQMLGEIENDLRRKMHIDCIGLFGTKNMFGFENKDWKPWTMFDGTRVLVPGLFNTVPDENGDIPMYACGDRTYSPCARMPKGGFYFDSTVRQKPIDDDHLRVEDNLEEFGPLSEEELEHLRKSSEWLYTNTGYAVVYSMPGTSFGDIAFVPGPGIKDPRGIRSVEEWYVSTVIRRDYVYEVFERECEIGLSNLARVREAAGDRIEVIFITGADFGTQRGPFISPDVYRDLFMPFHKRLCGWIHHNTSWKTFMHSCGGIRPLLEDVIEAGFDIINPVQCSAEGMDAHMLKEDFGSRLTFWGGGVDTQKTLPFGSPEDVYREVSERIRIFNRDGGFIFNAIHNIQAGTPVENVLAMLKAIEDSF
ncbi:MAG: uroporphyrinogen decarboxylase family protein [Candidatus Latescibacter sp.]|nr:uroporphyrinogen decarboxylase family protein [Candidatus Latescibacter sp.]